MRSFTAAWHWLKAGDRWAPVSGSALLDKVTFRQRARDAERATIEAQAGAREIAARFDTVLNSISQGLCFFDGAERLIVCNQRYVEMYGLSPEKVRPGTTLREIVDLRYEAGTCPRMAREEYLAWRAGIVRTNVRSDTVVELQNGRIFEIHHRPMPDHGWVATHEDVTERYQAQRALAAAKAAAECAEEEARKAHTRLVDALDAIPEGLAVFDPQDRYVLWNRRYAEIYSESRDVLKPGATFEEVVRAGLARGQYPEASGREEQWLRERLDRHAQPQYTHEQHLPDDRWLRIEERRTADGGSIGVRIDITDLKRSEASFRLLFDENPLPMWVLDVETMELLAVNQAMCRHYGYTREQLLTMSIQDLRVPEEREQLREALRANEGVKRADTTRRHITADGRLIDVAIEARPLKYESRNACVAAAFDMTERTRAEAELREVRDFLDAVIESVPVTIFVKDARQQRYELTNRAAERLLGISRNDLIGKTAEEFFPEGVGARITRHDNELLATGRTLVHNEVPLYTRTGKSCIVNSTRILIHDREGKPQHIVRVVEDVTERKQAEQRIAYMARHDSLTDLPNRAAFEEEFARCFEEARAVPAKFAVMCMDLDGFKEINDLFGHAAGDAVLREVSRRLRSAAGGNFLARVGGDEFVLIAPILDNGMNPRSLAERLRAALAEDVAANAQPLHVGMSIGVAVFPDDGRDATTLIGNADAALYRAKHDGRAGVRFFTAKMDQQLRERRALQHDLRSAVEHNQLELHYQPQSRIVGGLIGFEALARWHHPKRGLIPPSEFIPIAEESGLIGEMGEWILREACREAASWRQPLQIAVNVSAVQFRRGNLQNVVHSALLESGLAPARLELEITEGVLVENFSRAASILRSLKALGVRIALDDFGTGYSSLSYLQSFPLDRIKIDRTFIAGLETSEGSLAIVRAVIGLAHGLGLPVLAEGVETPAQLAVLKREVCDDIQGYLIGRPRPISMYAEEVGGRVSRAKVLA